MALAEDEARARLRLIQLQRDKLAVEVPSEETGAVEPPSAGRMAAHALKGLGSAAFGVADLPHAVTTFTRENVVEPIADYFDVDMPNVSGFPSPLAGTIPKVSEMPGFKQLYEATASEELTPEEIASSPWAQAADLARTGLDWGAAGVPNLFRKGVSAIPDIAAAGGAMLGETVERLAGSDSEFGQMLGFFTALAAGRPKVPGNKAEQKAADYITQNAESPEDAVRLAEEALKRGDEGTLADLTGDRGIFDVEAGVATDPMVSRQIQDMQVDRNLQTTEQLREPLGTGQAVDAQAAAVAQTASRKALVDRGVSTLDAKAAEKALDAQKDITAQVTSAREVLEGTQLAAKQAAGRSTVADVPIGTTQRPAQTSTRISEAMDARELDFKNKVEDPAWKKFEAQPDVDTTGISAGSKAAMDELDPSILTDLKNKYGALLGRVEQWAKTGTATPAEVKTYFTRVKEALAKASNADEFGLDEINLKKVLTAMEKGMADVDDLYKVAKQATTDKYAKYGEGKLGKTRSKASPETLMKKLSLSDEAGAETVRLLKKQIREDPGMARNLANHLKSLGKTETVTQKFMDKYADAFDALPPNLREGFQAKVDAEIASTVATKELGTAEKAFSRIERKGDTAIGTAQSDLATTRRETTSRGVKLKSKIAEQAVAKYSKNPRAETARLIKDSDKVPQLTRLRRSMEKLGQEDAFKGQVRDALDEILVTNKGGSPEIKASAREAFAKLRKNLTDSGVMTGDEADTMATALERTGTAAKRKAAITRKMAAQGSEFDNLLASGMAAITLTAMPGTQTLLVGGAVRRMFRKMLSSTHKPATVAALEAFMLNPGKYVDAAKGAKTAREAARMILTQVVGAGQVAAALDEE